MSPREGGSGTSGLARGGTALAIRSFTSADYGHVFDLYRRAWPGDVERRKAAFRWIQEGNPFRHEDRGYLLAFRGSTLAGYWGRLPARFHHHGAALDVVFSQEALVDPAYRRQGIARGLAQEAVRGDDLYLSLWHNRRILDLLRSHGWRDLGGMTSHKRIHRPGALARWKLSGHRWGRALSPFLPLVGVLDAVAPRGRRAPEPDPGVRVEEVERFSDEASRLFRRVARTLPFVADRTAPTLNWRYVDIPHRSFKRLSVRDGMSLLGYIVLEVESLREPHLRRGTVVDVLVDPENSDALLALLHAAQEWFGEQEADLVVALSTLPGTAEGFRRAGYRAAPGRADSAFSLLHLDRRSHPRPPAPDDYGGCVLAFGDSDAHLW